MGRTLGRTWGALAAVGTLVLAPLTAGAAGAAVAEKAATDIYVAIVATEGPAAPAGTVFEYSAQLVSGANPVAGVPVTLMIRPAGAPDFTAAKTVQSGPDGGVEASVRLNRSTAYRWDFDGNDAFAASRSQAFVQQVGSRVRVATKHLTVRHGRRVVITGTTTPVQPGRHLSLWRGDKPDFAPDLHMTRIATGTVRPDGTLRLVVRFARAGAKRLYVKVNGGGGNAAGYSNYLHIRVR